MKLALTVVVASLALAGCASTASAPGADDHVAHHPAGSAAPKPPPAGYEQQMHTMAEMHRKMADAKTPEERAALMKDHMKTMHDGMAMMGQMRGGMMRGGSGTGAGKGHADRGTPMDADTMARRMDMMEMMMRMLMDREGMKPPPAR